MILDISDKNILNVYMFGSHVYGTNNEHSDKDYIVVVDKPMIIDDDNIKVYLKDEFEMNIINQKIDVLECLFLDKKFILKEEKKFEYILIRTTLRKSISAIISNSYVKTKKKILQGDKYLGIKSFFHANRILDYGIQLGMTKSIYNYSNMNWLYNDLIVNMDKYDNEELWQFIQTKYKEKFKQKKSVFKKICPKYGLNEINNALRKNGLLTITKEQYKIITNG